MSSHELIGWKHATSGHKGCWQDCWLGRVAYRERAYRCVFGTMVWRRRTMRPSWCLIWVVALLMSPSWRSVTACAKSWPPTATPTWVVTTLTRSLLTGWQRISRRLRQVNDKHEQEVACVLWGSGMGRNSEPFPFCPLRLEISVWGHRPAEGQASAAASDGGSREGQDGAFWCAGGVNDMSNAYECHMYDCGWSCRQFKTKSGFFARQPILSMFAAHL